LTSSTPPFTTSMATATLTNYGLAPKGQNRLSARSTIIRAGRADFALLLQKNTTRCQSLTFIRCRKLQVSRLGIPGWRSVFKLELIDYEQDPANSTVPSTQYARRTGPPDLTGLSGPYQDLIRTLSGLYRDPVPHMLRTRPVLDPGQTRV
jgi:hypothetical protein